jgi:hypothetical protein
MLMMTPARTIAAVICRTVDQDQPDMSASDAGLTGLADTGEMLDTPVHDDPHEQALNER